MKREFLKGLELSDEVINKIMEENGRDIEKEKAKFADYEDIKSQLQAANSKIESFGDVEAIKADVEKYKAEAAAAKAETAAKIKKMETQGKIKDFTSGKKFVNNLTRDSINAKLEAALDDDSSKGKSLDELFTSITEGLENILVDESKPVPPVTTPMQNVNPESADDDKIRAAMGLPAKKN